MLSQDAASGASALPTSTTGGSNPAQQQQVVGRKNIQLQRMAAIQHAQHRTPVLTRMTAFHPMLSPPGSKPKSSILYSTGRSVSIAATTLEPTYPWDYDLDNDLDDGLDDDDFDDDDIDLAGERYVVNDEDEDYQHPSLETSRTFLNIFHFAMRPAH